CAPYDSTVTATTTTTAATSTSASPSAPSASATSFASAEPRSNPPIDPIAAATMPTRPVRTPLTTAAPTPAMTSRSTMFTDGVCAGDDRRLTAPRRSTGAQPRAVERPHLDAELGEERRVDADPRGQLGRAVSERERRFGDDLDGLELIGVEPTAEVRHRAFARDRLRGLQRVDAHAGAVQLDAEQVGVAVERRLARAVR